MLKHKRSGIDEIVAGWVETFYVLGGCACLAVRASSSTYRQSNAPVSKSFCAVPAVHGRLARLFTQHAVGVSFFLCSRKKVYCYRSEQRPPGGDHYFSAIWPSSPDVQSTCCLHSYFDTFNPNRGYCAVALSLYPSLHSTPIKVFPPHPSLPSTPKEVVLSLYPSLPSTLIEVLLQCFPYFPRYLQRQWSVCADMPRP